MMSSVRGGTCAHAVHPGYSLAGKTGTAQNRGRDHSVFMGFAPVDTPKIAIAVYVENGGFGADYGVPIGSLMIEQYINGKLTPGDAARADALQKRHISYPFKRPLSRADSLRLDSIKRVNQIKDSLKMVNQKLEAAEAAKLKEAQQQKEAEEKEKKKQPQNEPAIKVEPEELIKTEKKGKDKDKDKSDKGKEKPREKERDKAKEPKEARKESKDNNKDKQQKSKDNKAKDKPRIKSNDQDKAKSNRKENVNRGK